MTDQLAFHFAAEIVPFPAARMRGRLRTTATYILAKPPSKRGWHYKHEVNRIWHEGKTARLPDHVVGAQMRAFAVALQNEMRRQTINAILIQQHGGAA